METAFDLIVIGAGPGGYVAAIRAAQLGLKTAIIERDARLGGTCLRIGCIPSKAMLESSAKFEEMGKGLSAHGISVKEAAFDLSVMLRRKDNVVTALTKGVDGLMKKNGVTRFTGHGRILGQGRVAVDSPDKADATHRIELTGKNILIATGSKSAQLPGVEVDGKIVGTSTEALEYTDVPKRLIVIGAGAIGLELGSVWRRLGSQVTVVEYLNRILPGMDAEIADEARRILEKQGMVFKLGVKVKSARPVNGLAEVEIEGGESLQAERVLVAVGRIPNTENLGLEAVGIVPDARGRIHVDEKFATSSAGVYAIGDVIPGAMLAHKAEEEGIACVESLVGGFGHVNYEAIPGIVYTDPEVAGVGRTEEDLKSNGIPYRKGAFPFAANGRARALGHVDGRVKVLAHAETDRLLGVHIVGPHAGDLIAEAAVAIEFSASAEDLARSCHAHPTLAEAVKEAAMAAGGRAIHI